MYNATKQTIFSPLLNEAARESAAKLDDSMTQRTPQRVYLHGEVIVDLQE
jgi:hypothetical protein